MATAEAIAEMLGGKVVAQNAVLSSPGSPFHQDQPNYMVELPNGNVINPGTIAQAISVKQPRAMIDALIYSEVNNTSVAVGQAPPFVPVNSTSSGSTSQAIGTDPAQALAVGAPSFSLSDSDPFISQMFTVPGSSTAVDASGSAGEQMQTILKMMRVVSQMSSIRHSSQPKPHSKRSVSK
jgi:hypothetical protein